MKPLPRYVQAVRVKGHNYLYFRHGRSRIRLPDDPASPAFLARYGALLTGSQRVAEVMMPGSVRAAIVAYRASPEFARLSAETRTNYARHLDRLAQIADFPLAEIKRAHIRALRDQLKARPSTADVFVGVVRRCLSLAVRDEIIATNPAAGIERIDTGGSYEAWTDAECQAFETAHSEGRVPDWAMTAYMLARYTAQRRGDVLDMTWSLLEAAKVEQGKTGARLTLTLHSRLRAYLAGLPRVSLLLLTTPSGRAGDRRNFTRSFRAVLDGIGLADRHLHGLRHKTASELAEAGCSEAEIQEVTGHATSESVRRYTRAARQRTMAESAILKLERHDARNTSYGAGTSGGTETESGKPDLPVANRGRRE